jgi:hypothetical protein
MFAPASTPPTPEEIAAAIARAQRRLVLLGAMMEFCLALLRAMKPGGAAGALLMSAQVKAFDAISRAARLGARLEMETHRLLRELRRGVLPAPKAGCRVARADAPSGLSTESAQTLHPEETGRSAGTPDGGCREPVETESDTGFRHRLEAFEARLEDADGPDWSALETARTLCRVLRFEPDWIGWLDDGWIDENLDLRRMLADSCEAGRAADAAPPHPVFRATFPVKGLTEHELTCGNPPPAVPDTTHPPPPLAHALE